ncbi:MAG: YfiR family protein [Methylovulum sp.]|nr:YfiR family protein [Methylovulum sp.]
MRLSEKIRDAFKPFQEQTLLACLLVWVCMVAPVFADGTKEQQVKVSFIYNFAKFITWPPSARAGGPFIICVVGEQPLSGNIGLLQARDLNDRTIEVRTVTKPGLGDCHILFIGEDEGQRLPDLLQDIAAQPVLSISDLPDFALVGGIIGMKVIDDRVRFEINLAAARKVGLTINSQLLKLATKVLQ